MGVAVNAIILIRNVLQILKSKDHNEDKTIMTNKKAQMEDMIKKRSTTIGDSLDGGKGGDSYDSKKDGKKNKRYKNLKVDDSVVT